jgi:hypothetical protein
VRATKANRRSYKLVKVERRFETAWVVEVPGERAKLKVEAGLKMQAGVSRALALVPLVSGLRPKPKPDAESNGFYA